MKTDKNHFLYGIIHYLCPMFNQLKYKDMTTKEQKKLALNYLLTNIKQLPIIKGYYDTLNIRPTYEKFELGLYDKESDTAITLSFNFDDGTDYILSTLLNQIKEWNKQ